MTEMKKALAIVLVVILVVNLVLYAIGKSNALVLWGIIVAAGIAAFYILPKMK